MGSIDPARWQRLSPLLDELLDLPAAERAARLAVLRAGDAALADELAQLLAQDEALEAAGFLAQPALAEPTRRAGPRPGLRVGAYQLERELGTGGMGSVWLARRDDGRFEGHAAIKFLRAGLAGPAEAERFAREGRILGRLAHPHIARLLDAGLTHEGQPYLVIEHVDGRPIDAHAQAHRLDVQARVRLLLDVLDAVAHAHNRLILHRDLKPSNILVSAEGAVKLLDFGISKLLEGGAREEATALTERAGQAFTPQYAAPEQWEGGEVTTATDVYALGVLAYRLLGGGHPTAADDATHPALMRGALETEPQRLSEAVRRQGPQAPLLPQVLEGDLDTIVAKALKKAPAERYPNAGAMADDLRRWLAHEPIAARPDSLAYRSAKFLRRNRLAVGAAALTVAGLATGLVVALQQAQEAARRQAEAEGLIEFMLGDLRTRLQPVGRLDVLDAVGAKALAHYGAQPATGLDAAALGRRARALHLLGEIAEQRGNLDEAARRFEQAAEDTGRLLQRAPGDAQRLFDHGQSQYWLGYVARRRGQLAVADTHFKGYLDLADRLVALDNSKLDWQVERAHAGLNLGVLRLQQGRAVDALVAFHDARQRWSRLLAARPTLARELANTLGWVARAEEELGRYDAAIEAQHAKLAALQVGTDAERDREVQTLRANGWGEIGRLHLARGDAAVACTALQRAIQFFHELVAFDGDNLDWKERLAISRLGLAEGLLALGERRKAVDELDMVDALVATLLASAKPRPAWRLDLRGRALSLRARLAIADGMPTSERHVLRQRLRQALADWPPGPQPTAMRAQAAAALGLAHGDLEQSAGQITAARQAWRAALAQLGADATTPPALTLRGLLEARLGALVVAREVAERVKSSAYRHPLATELMLTSAAHGR